jgi:predicted hydrocarbon binding protein
MAEIDQKEFTQNWLKNFFAILDANLDEQTKMKMMEECGRSCARTGPIRAAQKHKGNLDSFLVTFAKWHGGAEYIQKDGNKLQVTCKECYCPLVKDGPATLPYSYCFCSRGWMKELFETVMGKPVEVELIQSIKRGAENCKFTIQI